MLFFLAPDPPQGAGSAAAAAVATAHICVYVCWIFLSVFCPDFLQGFSWFSWVFSASFFLLFGGCESWMKVWHAERATATCVKNLVVIVVKSVFQRITILKYHNSVNEKKIALWRWINISEKQNFMSILAWDYSLYLYFNFQAKFTVYLWINIRKWLQLPLC